MSIGVIEMTPIAITDAATVPVIAPRIAPTKITAYDMPPRTGPNNCPIEFEQVFGEAAALQDRAHEGEERDRQQQVVRDDAEQLIGEVAEEVRRDQTQLDPDEAEEQAREGKREGGRITDRHEDDHAPEHQGRHVVANEGDH